MRGGTRGGGWVGAGERGTLHNVPQGRGERVQMLKKVIDIIKVLDHCSLRLRSRSFSV